MFSTRVWSKVCELAVVWITKPGHESYKLTAHVMFTKTDDVWTMREKDINNFDLGTDIRKLSARYSEYPKYEISESAREMVEENKKHLNNKKAKKKTLVHKTLDNAAILRDKLEELFESLEPLDYVIKETHDYTMALPESYYGPGSYNKWLRVGWALASTSPKLFMTWLAFSSRDICRDTLKGPDGKFDWSNVSDLRTMWDSFTSSENADGLTNRSIIFWCKRDAEEEYKKIHTETVHYYIYQSIRLEKDKTTVRPRNTIFPGRSIICTRTSSLRQHQAIIAGMNIASNDGLRLIREILSV